MPASMKTRVRGEGAGAGSVRVYVQILELWKRSWHEGDCRDQPQIPSEGPYHDR